MKAALYNETQRYPQVDRVFITATLGLFLVLILSGFAHVFDWTAWQWLGAFAVMALLMGAVIYLWKRRMKLAIRRKSLRLEYTPIDFQKLKVRWKDVAEIEVMPLPREYKWKGWDVHFSSGNKWYNLSGTSVLKLTLHSGKTILVGCKKPQDVVDILKKNERTKDLLKEQE